MPQSVVEVESCGAVWYIYIFHYSRFHDGLILFQFDTIAPNLVPLVSNDLVQLSQREQMKKVPKS